MFACILHASAFVQVSGFANPEWHVEIEADSYREPK
jgi:enamine deaminase RidA (YjgF/YER057c/UK114 family)